MSIVPIVTSLSSTTDITCDIHVSWWRRSKHMNINPLIYWILHFFPTESRHIYNWIRHFSIFNAIIFQLEFSKFIFKVIIICQFISLQQKRIFINFNLGASHKSKRRTDNVFRTFGGGGVKTPGRYLFKKVRLIDFLRLPKLNTKNLKFTGIQTSQKSVGVRQTRNHLIFAPNSKKFCTFFFFPIQKFS